MKTKHFTGIRYAYSVTTKWISIEKYEDLMDLYNFSLKKVQKTETKTSDADSSCLVVVKYLPHIFYYFLRKKGNPEL